MDPSNQDANVTAVPTAIPVKAVPTRGQPVPRVSTSDSPPPQGKIRAFLRSFGACAISMFFHIALLLVLAFVVMPVVANQPLASVIAEIYEDQEEEILNIELEPEIESATELTTEITTASREMGITGSDLGGMRPQLDTKVVEQLTEISVNVGPPDFVMPSENFMIQSVPDGARGDERFVTDNIEQALSQITQELIVLLEKGPVLVVWLFDMSDSMSDDREEIRNRIDRVYEELGIIGKSRFEDLTTAVTSYGSRFVVNTRRGPTSNLEEIRAAIDSVQTDKSGMEIMCEAVGRAINVHRQTAERQRRQMALILVSDESGEPVNNEAFLERAIAEAKAAKCRVYALGREAAFGYPYIYFRWRDPSTKRLRPIPVDRGPETAFPEQLQIDGFRRRYDAFPSGFGPYVQTRMARETGGVFFMLPTEEGAQIGVSRRTRYELEAMRSYKPDLRAKLEVVLDRDVFPTRKAIWKVVQDLNPLVNEQRRNEIELTVDYPLDPQTFLRRARENQVKARKLLEYLSAAEKFLLENAVYREQEVSPRWQANYDLMIAQLVTFQVRVYEYGVYLDWFMMNPPKNVPPKRGPNQLHNFGIRRRKTTFAEDEKLWKDYPDREEVLEYIDRGKKLLRTVIKNHPGTPWAARAQWELSRGFGVYLVPEYDRPSPPGSKPTPKPKDPPVFEG